MVEEGLRPSNPARQTKRPRRRQPKRYRLTRTETIAVLEATRGTTERRAIYLAACAGLRRQELRGAQGRHFRRPGWAWVSDDMGKGQKERWIPVIADLEPVWHASPATSPTTNTSCPHSASATPAATACAATTPSPPPPSRPSGVSSSGSATGRASPPRSRPGHAYCDHVARHAGLQVAQRAMSHANLATTELYLSTPTRDELANAMRGITLGTQPEHAFQGPAIRAASPVEAPTGIEPVSTALQAAA